MDTQFRFKSVDLLRGLVVILMALDHARYFYSPYPFQPVDLENTFPILFFTRWVTHFCAPLFILLAGMSAAFYQSKGRTRAELALYLFTRGILLIVIELVWVNFWWQLGFTYGLDVQVLWAIGWSMITLAGLVYLPQKLILLIGLTMVLGHNLLDDINSINMGAFASLWVILHEKAWIPLGAGGIGIYVVYPLIPWLGVIALGYVLGNYIVDQTERFSRICFQLGTVLLLLFIILRGFNLYGDPSHWSFYQESMTKSLMSFLNTTKYPPSLLFLCMTIGPGLIFLSFLHTLRLNNLVSRIVMIFGSLPLFFYILHIPVITISAYFWSMLQFSEVNAGWQLSKASGWPVGYEPSLLRAYVVWGILLVLFYFCCRWYKKVKQNNQYSWLRYI